MCYLFNFINKFLIIGILIFLFIINNFKFPIDVTKFNFINLK